MERKTTGELVKIACKYKGIIPQKVNAEEEAKIKYGKLNKIMNKMKL